MTAGLPGQGLPSSWSTGDPQTQVLGAGRSRQAWGPCGRRAPSPRLSRRGSGPCSGGIRSSCPQGHSAVTVSEWTLPSPTGEAASAGGFQCGPVRTAPGCSHPRALPPSLPPSLPPPGAPADAQASERDTVPAHQHRTQDPPESPGGRAPPGSLLWRGSGEDWGCEGGRGDSRPARILHMGVPCGG